MSASGHLNPAQFGQQQDSDDDSDETDEERKRRERDAAREASKLLHPSHTQPSPEDRS